MKLKKKLKSRTEKSELERDNVQLGLALAPLHNMAPHNQDNILSQRELQSHIPRKTGDRKQES